MSKINQLSQQSIKTTFINIPFKDNFSIVYNSIFHKFRHYKEKLQVFGLNFSFHETCLLKASLYVSRNCFCDSNPSLIPDDNEICIWLQHCKFCPFHFNVIAWNAIKTITNVYICEWQNWFYTMRMRIDCEYFLSE